MAALLARSPRLELDHASGSSSTIDPIPLSHDDYTIGWICALPLELSAAKAMLDHVHHSLHNRKHDHNTYTLGSVGAHNIVMACMSSGVYGTTSATRVASQMKTSFSSIRFMLMVGIGGGAPQAHNDIRLGDVVVSHPTESFGGVVQYDHGKTIQDGVFHRTGVLNKPPEALLTAIASLRADHRMRPNGISDYLSDLSTRHPAMASEFANPPQQPDHLFESGYEHSETERTCDSCDLANLMNRPFRNGNTPSIYYGLIATANQVMKHALTRDKLARELGILCFEMEAGGLMDNFECLVIRGICDYADSHKNKQWQPYAASTAAAYAKELLSVLPTYQNRANDTTEKRMETIIEKWTHVATHSEYQFKPSFILPFRRDPDFVSRPVLGEILLRASEPGARVGLVGLGGVGKSQLAIEYAYRVHDANPDVSVFWVHASSAARFEESFRKIAIHLQLPESKDPKTDVLGLVYAWLSEEKNGPWTMIIDNADDAEVLFEIENGNVANTTITPDRTLSDFLPVSSNGSIVITSRYQDVVKRLQVYDGDVLDIGPMDIDMSQRLFLQKLKKGRQPSADELRTLVNILDGMPLAISQAAAYIDQCSPRMSVSRYIEMLEKSDKDRATLLQKDIRDPRRDRTASNSIIKTWYVTFTHLRRVQDSAARLLALMSMFDREAIPELLLHKQYVQEPEHDTDFEDDVATLRAYSLIDTSVGEEQFEMHRLVQLSTQKWLEMQGELDEWQERFIKIICSVFTTEDYPFLNTCQSLFPHMEMMCTYRVSSTSHRLIWAEGLFRGSLYAWSTEQYNIAERMVRASLQTREELVGLESAATLESMHYLALILKDQGLYSEADKMYRQSISGRERVLGVDHPTTLRTVNNLALSLRNQGRFSESEEMVRQVLAKQQAQNLSMSDIMTSMKNLALVLQDQEKYSEAEEILRQFVVETKKALEVDSPNTKYAMTTLAGLLEKQGELLEAEKMYRMALSETQRMLGEEHPDALECMNSLALVLGFQNKFEEGEKLLRYVLLEKEKVFGVNHPNTLHCVHGLAWTLAALQKYSEAEKMHRRVLIGKENALGPDHEKTIHSVYSLARDLGGLQRYSDALIQFDRAIDGFKRIFGPDHHKTVFCVRQRTLMLKRRRNRMLKRQRTLMLKKKNRTDGFASTGGS